MAPERRAALVTGGSRGIGLGIARALTDSGFDVAINGVRDEAQVVDALDALAQGGSQVCYCRGDVAVAADRQAIVDAVRARFGRLDVLVNNAGVAPGVRADVLEAT
jgi:NAD(P)-dependent dehydrogenase (short-subunit alcohol dehydrogenase family)